MFELVALFLVGLSLFFHGVGGLKTHLQGLTSRRLRRQLARWSQHSALAGACGFFFGAITQSSTAVAFILAGLVSNGLITLARALPIVAWANLGTVVLASIDVHTAFLYLLGIAGLALAFELGSANLRPALASLFSIGLLFFGLQMMKQAFAPLPGFFWFNDLVAFLQGSVLAAFVAGALLRLLVQSSSGIAVIAIALAHGGLLSAEQAAMMIYGTGVGVGLSVFLLSSNLRGVPRQLALYQAAINAFSGFALCALFYVEQLSGWPLALHLARAWATGEAMRLAFAFLFLQATSVAVALAGSRLAPRWLEKLSPSAGEEDLARPRYLSENALSDPESALDLAEKEQCRLVGYLPVQLETVRAETAATATLPAETLHLAATAVGGEIQAFLRELMNQHADRDTSERLLALERRQALLGSLDEAIYGFVGIFAKLQAGGASVGPLLDNLAESLNTLVLTAGDAVVSQDNADAELLIGLTSDRGELMERLRRNLLADTPALDSQQKAHLFYLTSLFERSVWLLHQLGLAQISPDHAARPVAQS